MNAWIFYGIFPRLFAKQPVVFLLIVLVKSKI